MSKQALITLTPLEPYFFGGELTHGDGGANYFAKSNRWPQQSTLCGVLRHLLFENGYSRGLHSFDPDAPHLNDYGHLLGLSPLFLARQSNGKTDYFLRQALDRYKKSSAPSFSLQQNDGDSLFLTETTQRLLNEPEPDNLPDDEIDAEKKRRTWQAAPVWQIPDAKKSAADDWVSPGAEQPVSAAEIFIEHTRPGITKARGGAPRKDEANFYKQTAYRLAEGWSFALLAEFDDAVDLQKLDGCCLPAGGEKTVFSFQVKPSEKTFQDLFPSTVFYPGSTAPAHALVLVSDAFLPENALKYIAAGISERTGFRHIRTHLKADYHHENYGPLRVLQPWETPDAQKHTLTKSAKYSLFQRGSVFVCRHEKDLSSLKAQIDIAPWTKAGFNHFFTYQ